MRRGRVIGPTPAAPGWSPGSTMGSTAGRDQPPLAQSPVMILGAAGIQVIRTVFQAPLMNSICGRFLGNLRRECLDHVSLLGESHMRRVIGEYCRYFNDVRPHQSLAQRTPSSAAMPTATEPGWTG